MYHWYERGIRVYENKPLLLYIAGNRHYRQYSVIELTYFFGIGAVFAACLGGDTEPFGEGINPISLIRSAFE